MPRRFYLPQPLKAGPVTLGPEESHHLLRVLRLRAGDSVVLFDGQGTDARAVLTGISDGQAILDVEGLRASEAEPLSPIVLATAVPKGERFSWLVEKAVELGVDRLVPLRTRRSIVDPGAGKLQKMAQVVIAASKQCGRSRLMALDPVQDWKDFVDGLSPEAALMVAHPSGEPWERLAPATGERVFCIGPEGGFTAEEIDQAVTKGGRLLSLGPRILRIETAGLMLASLASHV